MGWDSGGLDTCPGGAAAQGAGARASQKTPGGLPLPPVCVADGAGDWQAPARTPLLAPLPSPAARGWAVRPMAPCRCLAGGPSGRGLGPPGLAEGARRKGGLSCARVSPRLAVASPPAPLARLLTPFSAFHNSAPWRPPTFSRSTARPTGTPSRRLSVSWFEERGERRTKERGPGGGRSDREEPARLARARPRAGRPQPLSLSLFLSHLPLLPSSLSIHRQGLLRHRLLRRRHPDGFQGRHQEDQQRVRPRVRRDTHPARDQAAAPAPPPGHRGGPPHHAAAEPPRLQGHLRRL